MCQKKLIKHLGLQFRPRPSLHVRAPRSVTINAQHVCDRDHYQMIVHRLEDLYALGQQMQTQDKGFSAVT